MPLKAKGTGFSFSSSELAPILLMQQVAREDMAIRHFQDQSVMSDSLMKRGEEQASVMAFASAEAGEKAKSIQSKEASGTRDSTTYTITYYNPESHKAEVLSAKRDIRIIDPATRSIEESVASQSLYPIYSYIGLPLMKVEIVPWRLEQILAERDYGTPPSGGSGASVVPIKLVALKESEVAAKKRRDEEMKAALEESILRKERGELKTDEEIIMLEETVELLRRGEGIDRALSRLPPLSRARYILLMRKKKVPAQIIIRMILREIAFLRSTKKKLSLFTAEDLIGMLSALRTMRKR